MAQRKSNTDKTTFAGGSYNILRWLDQKPTYLDMIRRLGDLNDIPRSERNNYFQGQKTELNSALSIAEDAMWKEADCDVR